MNDQFLENLAKHEQEKVLAELDSRQKLIMFSGARLNWIGDYLGNPDIEWEERVLDLDEIEFTGNDKFLIEDCERSPKKFQELVLANPELKAKYEKEASFGEETIIVRNSDHNFVKYKILDGIHRLLGTALSGKKTIKAMVPQLEDVLPYCEAHTIYDLIRGYLRHRQNEDGETELYHSLKLLLNTYSNTRELLEDRFNKTWVNDDTVQSIIKKVLEEKK